MRANDVRPAEVLRHGAYLCLAVPAQARPAVARAAIPELAERLGLRNEFDPGGDHPADAVALLRRTSVTPGEIADAGVLDAGAVIHVASARGAVVTEFCDEAARLLGPDVVPYVLRGVVRPPRFTGNEMHNFAYAHRALQEPGPFMPNAILAPMCKTAEWWEKRWMERHTYFLPRYEDSGRMMSEGHALAAAAGVPCLMRRTYYHPAEPAPEGSYDFVNYFECADANLPTFHAVRTALRDVGRNPEWRFVREGPTWYGRRVATWAELFG